MIDGAKNQRLVKKKRTLDETNNCCRSRGRGYAWEKTIVKRFDGLDYGCWTAMRLGGTTAYIPDVIATYTNTHIPKDMMLGIEAKSGTGTLLSVPRDQIERCQRIGRMFRSYTKKLIVLAFKFSVKKRIKKEFERRMLKEYFVVINPSYFIEGCIEPAKCDYNGNVTLASNNSLFKFEKDFNYWVFDSFDGLLEFLLLN